MSALSNLQEKLRFLWNLSSYVTLHLSLTTYIFVYVLRERIKAVSSCCNQIWNLRMVLFWDKNPSLFAYKWQKRRSIPGKPPEESVKPDLQTLLLTASCFHCYVIRRTGRCESSTGLGRFIVSKRDLQRRNVPTLKNEGILQRGTSPEIPLLRRRYLQQ